MADTKAAVPYDRLIAELAGLVATGSTGTLYITSTENRAIRIQLQDGEIVTCFFGPKQGLEALQRFRSVGGGSFRFDPKAPPISADKGLPTTDMILVELGYGPSRSALADRSAGGLAATPAPEPVAAPEAETALSIEPTLDEMFLETTGFHDAVVPTEAERTLEEMFLETTGFHDVVVPVEAERTLEAMFLESTGLHAEAGSAETERSLEEMFLETTGFYDVGAAAAQVEVPRGEFAMATELVTLEFACFVGPVANMWTTNYVTQHGPPRSGPELRQMIEAMAGEIQIHNRRKVRNFIQRVRQRLEPIL